MQGFTELVAGLVGNMQRMFGMVLLAGVAISAIIAITIYATAPVIAEETGERIETFAEARMAEAVDENRAAKCDALRARAAAAWDSAVTNDESERAFAAVDQLDRQAERYCNP